MFCDYYYAHSYTVMYRVESSVVSNGSNIASCWVFFHVNCQAFDPAPLNLGEGGTQTLKSSENSLHV